MTRSHSIIFKLYLLLVVALMDNVNAYNMFLSDGEDYAKLTESQ